MANQPRRLSRWRLFLMVFVAWFFFVGTDNWFGKVLFGTIMVAGLFAFFFAVKQTEQVVNQPPDEEPLSESTKALLKDKHRKEGHGVYAVEEKGGGAWVARCRCGYLSHVYYEPGPGMDEIRNHAREHQN